MNSKHGFAGWLAVSENLLRIADGIELELNDGQRASLKSIASRLQNNGVIIADEVGMGKTRIAVAIAKSVIAAGGRVAILVPPGLGYQWGDELRKVDIEAPMILRSLWQYLQAWESEDSCHPWFNENVTLISHAFTNWRLGEASAAWRWALLPELYARWVKITKGRLPPHYHRNQDLSDEWVRNAAKSIISMIDGSPNNHRSREFIQEMVESTPWAHTLQAKEYGQNYKLRPWLERAVGLGLGVYDLVIIDEAHKSRGEDSGLNKLIEHVVLQSVNARRIAMTATPVELDAEQWGQTLGRIKVDIASVSKEISDYAKCVRNVRQSPNNSKVREEYKDASAGFKQALNPYLIRRDKREDGSVKEFIQYSGERFHTYRREREILIDTATLPLCWKKTVCAAEALSFVTSQFDDSIAKRLRLTLGNGHGVAALIDQTLRHDEDDKKQFEADATSDQVQNGNSEVPMSGDKRMGRANWWRNVMMASLQSGGSGDGSLYDHTAILAAVNEIERVCNQDEKVLVFGRFTRPLRALVDLLNARAMLVSLDLDKYWPQSKVHDNEWGAISAAHQQLHVGALPLDRQSLNEKLDKQYKQLELKRRQIRANLCGYIESGIVQIQVNKRALTLFNAFKKESLRVSEQEESDDVHPLTLLSRAIQELIGPSADLSEPIVFATAFSDLVEAVCDRDDSDANQDVDVDDIEAEKNWRVFEARLREEYNRLEGGFARLMYGGTKPETRRLLQLAFNRRNGHPKVLVAQSVVGREGLNLHKACKTVVMLHPEWNPGVVEQQIGRVDRIGSLWETMLKEAIGNSASNDDLPRIEICPVVFKGTYDEYNWQVLRGRWEDLRAQLHGIVISPQVASKCDEAIVAEINDSAPCFSPTAY